MVIVYGTAYLTSFKVRKDLFGIRGAFYGSVLSGGVTFNLESTLSVRLFILTYQHFGISRFLVLHFVTSTRETKKHADRRTDRQTDAMQYRTDRQYHGTLHDFFCDDQASCCNHFDYCYCSNASDSAYSYTFLRSAVCLSVCRLSFVCHIRAHA